MDYRRLDSFVQESFQKLEEKERLLNEKIKEFDKNIKPLKVKKALLSQQVESLKSKKKQMEEKINLEDYIIQSELLQTQQKYQRYGQAQMIKEFYETIIGIILCQLEEDLKENLKCSSTETAMEVGDTRETYRVYGLLLSACEFRKKNPEIKIITQVLSLHENKEILRDNIQKAVVLTKDMLTLIPPLLVTTVPQYNEKLHDTNRSTWDEFANESRELTYYRPILVYGNQLHVAMKGLVGNTAQKQPQQQLLPEQQRQQPLHIQIPQQTPQYQVQQPQPDPSQVLQQPQMILPQQQQPHYQQQHNDYHPWQEKTGAYARTTGSFQATHPHVPENNLCFVCNNPWYYETQCDYVGPHKLAVHKECHSCIECKGKHQLKLYYGKFVCTEHINKLICQFCGTKGHMKFRSKGFFCASCQETIC